MSSNIKKAFWSFLEIFETVIVALIAVFIIRTFVAQPFLVSGSSMEPSFDDGNYLIVDELSYNFRSPERGEVVVFDSPDGTNSYYIKRIVGLPGEKVVIDGDKVEILSENGDFILEENYISDSGFPSVLYKEETLGPDEYFVMGDNRGFSFDSRSWGPLQEESIVGLVRFRLWPINQVMAVEKPIYEF